MSDFVEYLPYAFALVIAIPFLVLLRQFVFAFINLKNQELKLLGIKGGAENKAQAYERMTLFLERMKPAQLVGKFDKTLKIREFVFLTEKSVNEEFEYNASQQLYLSKTSWQNIVNSKLSVVELLHKTLSEMGENSSLDDFKTVFLMNYMNEQDFISTTIDGLRREVLIVT